MSNNSVNYTRPNNYNKNYNNDYLANKRLRKDSDDNINTNDKKNYEEEDNEMRYERGKINYYPNQKSKYSNQNREYKDYYQRDYNQRDPTYKEYTKKDYPKDDFYRNKNDRYKERDYTSNTYNNNRDSTYKDYNYNRYRDSSYNRDRESSYKDYKNKATTYINKDYKYNNHQSKYFQLRNNDPYYPKEEKASRSNSYSSHSSHHSVDKKEHRRNTKFSYKNPYNNKLNNFNNSNEAVRDLSLSNLSMPSSQNYNNNNLNNINNIVQVQNAIATSNVGEKASQSLFSAGLITQTYESTLVKALLGKVTQQINATESTKTNLDKNIKSTNELHLQETQNIILSNIATSTNSNNIDPNHQNIYQNQPNIKINVNSTKTVPIDSNLYTIQEQENSSNNILNYNDKNELNKITPNTSHIEIKNNPSPYTTTQIDSYNDKMILDDSILNTKFNEDKFKLPINILTIFLNSKGSDQKKQITNLLNQPINPNDPFIIKQKNEFSQLIKDDKNKILNEIEHNKLEFENIINNTYVEIDSNNNKSNRQLLDPLNNQNFYLDESKLIPQLNENKSKNLNYEIFHLKKIIEKESYEIKHLTEKIKKIEMNDKLIECKQIEIRKSLNEIFSDF